MILITNVCVCVCVCVCVFVFVELHETAQSGRHPSYSMSLALILARGDQLCMFVCVFIKLHITAQSDPVILVILCHSH